MLKNMFVIRFFVISSTTLFTIRTFCLLFGKNFDQKSWRTPVFLSCFLNLCSFFATKNKIFVAFLILTAIFAPYLHFSNIARPLEEEIEIFIDHVIMSMRGGLSLESIFLELNTLQPKWKIFFVDGRTNGQSSAIKDVVNLFAYCRKHPTQSCGVLESFRTTLRLRSQLQRKHKMISLQAKAQAMVSLLLFLVIFVFQWASVPEFKDFLNFSIGRLLITLSFLLVGLGIGWIFKMGKPGELHL